MKSSKGIASSPLAFLNRLRIKEDHQELLLRLLILVLIYILAFATRLFSVLRYESVIHEVNLYNIFLFF